MPGRRLLSVAALAVAALVGAWWAWHAADPSLAHIRAAGVLRVGYAVEAPYALTQADGSVGGESPEVAREVARRLGVDTRWVLTEFESLIPELEKGRIDLVAAGLFVNAERARRIAFTRATLRVRAGWLTRAGNPKSVRSYARPPAGTAARVAVVAGSVEQAAIARSSWPAASVLVVPDAASGEAAVAAGDVDALALSWPSVRQLAQGSGGRLQALPAEDAGAAGEHQVALAVRRDAERLRRAIDEVLVTYIGSDAHLAVLARLGLSRDDLPEAGLGP